MEQKDHFTGCTINYHPCRCFDHLNEDERTQIEAHSVVIKYKRGELISKQGSFASHIMYIEKGLVKVFIENNNKSLVLKILPDGHLLGLSSLNDEHSKFHYSSMAYIDSEVKQIDMGFFKQLLEKNTSFAKEVINVLSSNAILINGRFFCMTHKQSFGKLADIILCLSDRVFKSSDFELLLSRKDLAELSGMSEETVIRMLKSFKEDGLIELNGKNFKILDYQKLKQVSELG